MSSSSRHSPQPEPALPHFLISEVPQDEEAGGSDEEGPEEPASRSAARAKAGASAKVGKSTAAGRAKAAKKSPKPEASKSKKSEGAAGTSKAAAKPKRVPESKTAAKRASASAATQETPKSRPKVSLVPPLPDEGPKGVARSAAVTPAKSGVTKGAAAKAKAAEEADATGPEVKVRRMHRRDLNRTWEFLKMVFRGVNRETVEYQRPRSKVRFVEVYEEEGEQLLFEVGDQIVGYAECAFDVSGADNWINPRYFDKRGMRPLYVDELAVHPDYQGRGVGSFMLDQVQHLARVRGCTHLVLEVAENNKSALSWYHKRNFFRLDAAIFLAQKVPAEPELLPPRRLPPKRPGKGKIAKASAKGSPARKSARSAAGSRSRKR